MNLKSKNKIIAIDGYSSCGKSTFAKTIAKRLGYLYIDTGAMYRAFTLACIREGVIKNNNVKEDEIQELLNNIYIDFKLNKTAGEYETLMNGENVEASIRSTEVSRYVSTVSKLKPVRDKMVTIQRKIAESKNIVMEGRDIGTVVFPCANIKIFMTASLEVRARRRYMELTEKGIKADFEKVKENILYRDNIDENRIESPLKKAADATLLDNTDMTLKEQMEWFLKNFNNTLSEKETKDHEN